GGEVAAGADSRVVARLAVRTFRETTPDNRLGNCLGRASGDLGTRAGSIASCPCRALLHSDAWRTTALQPAARRGVRAPRGGPTGTGWLADQRRVPRRSRGVGTAHPRARPLAELASRGSAQCCCGRAGPSTERR